jgi:hypothetical protein
MQKWEYLTVDIYVANGRYRPKNVGSQELANWQRGPTAFEYLNHLGEQGWELITTTISGSEHEILWLKRPKLT